MEPFAYKLGFLRNVLVRILLLFGVFIVIGRFAYIITIASESCNVGNFCFFFLPETINFAIAGAGTHALVVHFSAVVAKPEHHASKDWINGVCFYSSILHDLIAAV